MTATASSRRRRAVRLPILALVLSLLLALVPALSATAAPSSGDPFYRYTGSTPLSSIAPGTVLKTRTLAYHLAGVPLPLEAVQLLYRTANQLGTPVTNVTTVVQPVVRVGAPRLAAYQSFYDSLNPNDEPSVAIAGGVSLGGAIANVETAVFAPLLLAGYSIAIADTEGQQADFAAGPEYGITTLDGIRAALHSARVGLGTNTRVGLLGYSGGAIATEWAAELAPSYAPDLNRNLVGAAQGGVLVDPAHNLHYVDGSAVWAGVMPMAIVGVSRAFGVDLTPYLSAYGKQVAAALQKASISQVLAAYPGLTWTKLALPQYPTPESVPVYVQLVNHLIMGRSGTPRMPMMFGQGANGVLEGTAPSPTYGAGDGVMIAGDVRTLARQYCAAGVKVSYTQYDALSHFTTAPVWIAQAVPWLMARVAGLPAPSNCASIAPGNPLTPIGE